MKLLNILRAPKVLSLILTTFIFLAPLELSSIAKLYDINIIKSVSAQVEPDNNIDEQSDETQTITQESTDTQYRTNSLFDFNFGWKQPTITLKKVVLTGTVSPSVTCWDVSPSINGKSKYCVTGEGNGIDAVVIKDVPTGFYNIVEEDIPGYKLDRVSCNSDCHFDGRKSIIWVSAGWFPINEFCTYYNKQIPAGSIVVHKNVVGPNWEAVTDTSTNFTIKLNNSNDRQVTDEGTVTYNNLTPGLYFVSENNIPSAYTFGSITPNYNLLYPLGTWVWVADQQTTDVYITNKQKVGNITVVKNLIDINGNPINSDIAFDVTLKLNESTVGTGKISDASVNPKVATFTRLTPGTYQVVETPNDNYISSCTDAILPSNGNIIVTCTNQEKVGTVRVHKEVVDMNNSPTNDDTEFTAILKQGETTVGTDVMNDKESNKEVAEFNVAPGTYSLSEETNFDYDFVSCTQTNFTITTNQTIDITCTNKQKPATITVYKDVINPDGDETTDSHIFNIDLYREEARIDGGQISDDENNPLVKTFTVTPGEYSILESNEVNYDLLGCSENREENYRELSDSSSFYVGSNGSISITCINQQKKGTITVTKNVIDPDGVDVSDNTNFLVNLYDSNNNQIGETQEISASENGALTATFTVNPGSYRLVESENGNFIQLGCTPNEGIIFVGSNDNFAASCKNQQKKANILVRKEVINREGSIVSVETEFIYSLTQGENILSASVKGDSMTPITPTFSVNPGIYNLTEVLNYNYDYIGCLQFNDNVEDTPFEKNLSISIGSNQTADIICRNQVKESSLTISKTNNKTSTKAYAGENVSYTITLTSALTDLTNVTITDLLPAGFIYIPGSYVVTSSIDGVITIEEPANTTPRIWNIGSIKKGEIITLTYSAHIESSVLPGSYTNIAYANADDPVLESIQAISASSADEYFVSSKVTVSAQPKVLGASTLPSTGMSMNLITGSLFSAFAGLALVLSHLLKKRQ